METMTLVVSDVVDRNNGQVEDIDSEGCCKLEILSIVSTSMVVSI